MIKKEEQAKEAPELKLILTERETTPAEKLQKLIDLFNKMNMKVELIP